MNTCNENTYTTAINTAVAPLAQEKVCKTSWYSVLKESPEILAKFKECTKQRYEDRKKAFKEQVELGLIENKPYTAIDPERRKRYNSKYYSTRKDKINDYHLRRYREQVKKTSPEKLERERERLRLYQQKKSAMPEELERKKLYAREYRKKKSCSHRIS